MRCEPKGRAMHHRDAFGGEQVFGKIFVALDDLAVRRLLAQETGAGRIDVERPFRPRAMKTGDLVQPVDDEIAALLEDLGVGRDEILRPIQGLDRGG